MIERVVVLNDVCIARGGATGLALDSIRALRARGVAVTLICGDNGDNAELRDLGVEIVAIGQALLLDAGPREAFFRGVYNTRTVAVVGEWLRHNDTQGTVYHLHNWTKILSPSLFRVLHPVASRLVLSAHDFFLVCPNGGYVIYRTGQSCQLRPMSSACLVAACDRRSYAHKLWRVARQAVREMLFDFRRTAPFVLAVHDGMRAGLQRGGVPAGSIKVLRNPVTAFRNERIPAERNREIVFVGRLHSEKGPDRAARAARRAGVRLRIIGDGPMAATLRASYPDVVFDGWRSPAEIGAAIASARALVMPSRYPEPFGLVACEALWSGLPVILGDDALLAKEIVALEAGIACDVSDETALANALRRLLDSDIETRRMSINAFEKTRCLATTPEEWSAALIAVYERLIAASLVDRAQPSRP